MNNLKCPYCGKKISYLSAIRERANGEHSCDRCKRNATIYFVRNIKIFIVVICLIALAMLSIFLFTPLKGKFYCVLLMFIPFLIFYFCIPLFIRFVPIKHKVKTKKNENDIELSEPVSASGTTRIINQVNPDRTVDPKGSPDYTRMIPKIRERKRKNKSYSKSNEEFFDISKL